jgi:predicted RND superfamily exporter protein
MIPNLMPIILVLGAMGWAGLELSVFTMMTGSIAIGLAVDDTIHFIHQFYRYRSVTGSARIATRETMRTTGLAMLTTSIVLSFGFIVFVFAEIRNLVAFGIVTTASIALAFITDIVVTPALLTLVSRRYESAEDLKDE